MKGSGAGTAPAGGEGPSTGFGGTKKSTKREAVSGKIFKNYLLLTNV